MSEVSLRAAYGAYEEHRRSNSLEDLYASIVKGQAEYGYKITHIYSFIDVADDVQLFYCRDGNHEDLLTSPYVKQRALLWHSGETEEAPQYLKLAYAEFLGVSDDEIAKLGLTSNLLLGDAVSDDEIAKRGSPTNVNLAERETETRKPIVSAEEGSDGTPKVFYKMKIFTKDFTTGDAEDGSYEEAQKVSDSKRAEATAGEMEQPNTPKEQLVAPRQEQSEVTAKDSIICSSCLSVARSESMGSALVGAAGMVLLVPFTVVVLSALFGSSIFRDLGGVMGFFFLGTLYGAFEIVRKAIRRPCPNCKHAPMTLISSSAGGLLMEKLRNKQLEGEKTKEPEPEIKNQQ